MQYSTPIALCAAFAGIMAAAASSAASGSIVSLYIPGADEQPLVASAVAVSNSISTFVIQCPASADSNDCGFPKPFTLIEGPSTVSLSLSVASDVAEVHCDIQGKNAVCTGSASGPEVTMAGLETYTDLANRIPVTVTAGQSLLGGAVASATGTASVASSTGSVAASKSSAGAPATSAASASVSAVSSAAKASGSAASSQVSAGAAPQVTALAGLSGMLAAAAMAVAALRTG